MIYAIILFAVTYILMLTFSKYRLYIALGSAVVFIITGLATNSGIDPTLLYFGLLSGATLGGNCTPIGASANVAGIGILRKEGYEVRTKDFIRIGIFRSSWPL